MDIAQLQNFQMIAKMENLTKAAENLHISQPALSASLNRLENELGVELFDRVGRRLHLNECGQIFLTYADSMLSSFSDAKDELSAYTSSQTPVLTVYVASKLGMDDLYFRYKQDYPDTILKRIEIMHNDVSRSLLEKDCDFVVITCMDPEEYNCSYEVVNEDRLLVAMPRTNPLADRDSLFIEELQNERFISLPSRSSFQVMANTLCEAAGFTPRVVAECYRCQLFTHMLSGDGISFVTESNFKDICHLEVMKQHLAIIPIANENAIMKDVVLWRNGKKLSKAANNFLKTIRTLNK